jgi:small ligand-binding sensory domain FIST
MPRFITAHATHPDARMALALAAAQIDAQRAVRVPFYAPTLGLVYITDHFASQAEVLLADLRQRWPGVAWAGGVGVGVLASGVEYHDEPALVIMLAALPAGQFQVFSGRQPMDSRPTSQFRAHTALVHADPQTHDLSELIHELADRTATGYLFGGLASSRSQALHLADGVFSGGLSGVAFGEDVHLISRVTQGSQPVGPTRHITACDNNVVLTLDDAPALSALLTDLGVTLEHPQPALAAMRHTLVGLADGDVSALARGGQFGNETRVRHLVGIDPGRNAVAVADRVQVGQQLAFCRRDVQAARRDLVRICTEIREEVEATETELSDGGAALASADGGPARIAGAVYISCTGRGGAHFGGPSAEALIIQHALGDVPLVGLFAAGEIARNQLYGYTGVLTVFTTD